LAQIIPKCQPTEGLNHLGDMPSVASPMPINQDLDTLARMPLHARGTYSLLPPDLISFIETP
jgi:hypothetical protein